MRLESCFRRPNISLRYPLFCCLSVLLALIPYVSLAAGGADGGVDWTQKRLWAKGMGVAPAGTPERLAGPMAERAALLDARRNLVEVLEQIYVDSQTTVSDFVTADDVVRNRVYGVLNRPDVDSVDIGKDGVCELIVSVPIAGDLAKALKARMPQNNALPAAAEKITEPRRIAGTKHQSAPQKDTQKGVRVARIVQPQRLAPHTEQPAAAAQRPAPEPEPVSLEQQSLQEAGPALPPPVVPTAPKIPDYTGLVVDARDLGFTPSLAPEIFTADTLLYPGSEIHADVAANGRVRYYRSLEQAQQGAMAGAMPLTIRAVGLYGDNTSALELNAGDAALLQSISQKPENFLNAGRVAIVF